MEETETDKKNELVAKYEEAGKPETKLVQKVLSTSNPDEDKLEDLMTKME